MKGAYKKMLVKVYSLYDEALKEYTDSFMFANDDVAERAMSTWFENGALFRQHPDMKKYPNTFSLMYNCVFDTVEGNYMEVEHKRTLFTFDKFVPKEDLKTSISSTNNA